jgi:AraC-like DNA-binding protein
MQDHCSAMKWFLTAYQAYAENQMGYLTLEAEYSFSKYLEMLRLSYVCQQLIRSTQTIEQIAIKNGFTNSNYLYYVFKKHHEMTPT